MRETVPKCDLFFAFFLLRWMDEIEINHPVTLRLTSLKCKHCNVTR